MLRITISNCITIIFCKIIFMKASNTRRPLHQQAVPEQQGPFFNKANDDAKKKDDAFFQTKLAVGEPGDKFEKEADKVADKVMKKAEEKEKPEVQKKGEDKDKENDKGAAGQAAAALPASGPKSAAADMAHKDKSPVNKDATGGNAKHGKDQATERHAAAAAPASAEHKEKAPDPKSSAGQMPHAPKDKLPGQGAGGQTPKEEEPKMINRKEAEKDKEPDVQKKSKDKEEQPIQKMSDGDKKEEDKTKVNKKEEADKQEEKPATAVMKEEAVKPVQPPVHQGAHKVSLEERIKRSKGKGQALPQDTKAFLEAELGADLSRVVIHTDSDAIAMSKELKAKAFTSGSDIYFNAGQYQPDTAEGRRLLAHELVHVVQQTATSKKKDKQ